MPIVLPNIAVISGAPALDSEVDDDLTSIHIVCGEPGAVWSTALICPKTADEVLKADVAWTVPKLLKTPIKDIDGGRLANLPQQVMSNSLGSMFQAFFLIQSKNHDDHVELFTKAIHHPRITDACPWITMYAHCIRMKAPVRTSLPMAHVFQTYFVRMRDEAKMSRRTFNKKMFRLLSAKVMKGCVNEPWTVFPEHMKGIVSIAHGGKVEEKPSLIDRHRSNPKALTHIKKNCIESFFLQLLICFVAGMTFDDEEEALKFMGIWDTLCGALLSRSCRLEIFPLILSNILSFIVDHMGSRAWLTEIAKHNNILKFLMHVGNNLHNIPDLREGATAVISYIIKYDVDLPDESLRASLFETIKTVQMRARNEADLNGKLVVAAAIGARARAPSEMAFGKSFDETIPVLLAANHITRNHWKMTALKGVRSDTVRFINTLHLMKDDILQHPMKIPGLAGSIANLILAAMEADDQILQVERIDEEDIVQRWMMAISVAHSTFGDTILAYLASMMKKPFSILTLSKCFGPFKNKIEAWGKALDDKSEECTDPITFHRVIEPLYLPTCSDDFDAFTLINSVWMTGRNPMTNEDMTLTELIAFNELPEQVQKRKVKCPIGTLEI